MTDPFDVVVDALEQAAFRGEWDYPASETGLTAAMATAEIVVKALTEAGCLTEVKS